MDQNFYHESMGSSIGPGLSHEVPRLDPNVGFMYASATANDMYADPALQHHLPTGRDVSIPDAPPPDSYYNNFEGMVTPDSIAPQPEYVQQAPIVDDSEAFGTEADAEGEDDDTEAMYHAHDYQAPVVDTDNILGTDADAEGEEDDLEVLKSYEYWKILLNFEIPDHTQTHINNIPHLQALYDTYLDNYRPQSPTSVFTRMQYAKALVFALLTHYYPTSQGYTVTPTSLGPVAANGMSFILAAPDNSDIYTKAPPYKPKAPKKSKSKPKKKKSAPTQAELQAERRVEREAKAHKVLCDIIWLSNLNYDIFPHERMAAFVVCRKTAATNLGTAESGSTVRFEWTPYTYSAIMIPEWDTLPTYSSTNSLHRGDVLLDAMCRGGNVKDGIGILLYGPLLEFYNFDAGAEWADARIQSQRWR
ncbi:hypothetical protein PtrSN002B_001871 [Pyrenophora tritici-repentis]|nr:hypothetical protein Alg130_07387 [Pyrenophora tritici-repentis]KAI0588311.1 hypothetical protein Alg215_00997 [Pyrenophora tritici-repentis]KAI0608251.1 hypothetical protein TUN205_07501 [Pyrenophora tritici-repentis]KAI0620517.1 hypothetical protein TUN199_07490 [Pyrenophora tritici-repentis]KAI1529789.1 hypothetical protein PtrSN001C_008911 [Pyrenophora tritici-repentis]